MMDNKMELIGPEHKSMGSIGLSFDNAIVVYIMMKTMTVVWTEP